ncbi:MAG: FAD-binding oxidoreductase, partial [Cellvibrionaceae bacterium]|nr:FAD-binding oxidoreductase [Cellvibrionaceae bacterium]
MTDHHFHPLKVAKIEQETSDSVSIVLDVPAAQKDLYLNYTQGQHLVMKANIKGEEVRRNYSLCSGVQDRELRVGIKKIDGGLFSSFANDELKEGDTLDVMPPEGSFNTALNPANQKHYLGFAAGSGITPILSILKTTLASEPNSVFTLVYGNKTVSDIMFRETILGLKNQYPERFVFISVLSREEQEAEILNGRIDADKVNALADKVLDINSVNEAF